MSSNKHADSDIQREKFTEALKAKLVDIDVAREILNLDPARDRIARNTFQSMVKDGRLIVRTWLIGKKLYYHKDDLYEYLESCQVS